MRIPNIFWLRNRFSQLQNGVTLEKKKEIRTTRFSFETVKKQGGLTFLKKKAEFLNQNTLQNFGLKNN